MAKILIDRKGIRNSGKPEQTLDAPDFRQCWDTLRNGLSPETLANSNAQQWHASSRDYGNGYKECAVWGFKPDVEAQLERAVQSFSPERVERGEGDVEANKIRNCRRAKKTVRLLCKSMGVNSLWTLTFRENVTDRAVVLKCFDAFRRRVVAVLGDWRYVAVLEAQKRGALHIHLGTYALARMLTVDGVKVKSWDVMRSIWRSCVGELGGNFDETKRNTRWGRGRPMKNASAIAGYIGAYVGKEMMDSELNKKRFSHSRGVDVPAAVKALWRGDKRMDELIEYAYAQVGETITKTFYCPSTKLFFVESYDPPS